VSIFVDNNYTLYVCDRENDRILKYEVNATTGTVVAGDGSPGNSPTQLNEPKGVAVDQMGAVIVADSSNYRIQRFPIGSLVGTTIAINSSANLLGQTRDLHIDVNNGIYITDSDYSRIVKFYPNNGIGVILAGSNGQGTGANQFNQPYGNFIDGNQTLFVADYGNHRIQKWPARSTSGTTVAGVTNSPGSTLARLRNPRAVVTDNNGYVINFRLE
jgi:sugar lactone lactonase YvrE